MRTLFTLLLFSTALLSAQDLTITTFGNPAAPAVIYLHGGPGYNAVSFERTAADSLAERGFFVISYDRRGEGRSTGGEASFTFDETITDILSLYARFNLETATLLGHSFGGLVALKFAELHPDKTTAIVLASAPLSMQRTFSDVLNKVRPIYEAKQDSVNLAYLDMLAKMDTASLSYSSYTFAHATQNGFYRTPTPTAAATTLYASLATDTLMTKYGNNMTFPAPMGFWKNERYTTLDLRPALTTIQVPVYGIYGEHDGLFSSPTVAEIKTLIGEENLRYLNNASHGVFIDRRTAFLDALVSWLR